MLVVCKRNDVGEGLKWKLVKTCKAGSTILGVLGENFKWILFLTLKSKFVKIKINLLHGSIN